MAKQPATHADPAPQMALDAAEENSTVNISRTADEVKAIARRAGQSVAAKAGQVGWKTAAGIGIGSAALVAALLYARRKD